MKSSYILEQSPRNRETTVCQNVEVGFFDRSPPSQSLALREIQSQ